MPKLNPHPRLPFLEVWLIPRLGTGQAELPALPSPSWHRHPTPSLGPGCHRNPFTTARVVCGWCRWRWAAPGQQICTLTAPPCTCSSQALGGTCAMLSTVLLKGSCSLMCATAETDGLGFPQGLTRLLTSTSNCGGCTSKAGKVTGTRSREQAPRGTGALGTPAAPGV